MRPFDTRLTTCFLVDWEDKSVTLHLLRPEPQERVRTKYRFQITKEPDILQTVSRIACLATRQKTYVGVFDVVNLAPPD